MRDAEGRTPLMLACEEGQLESITLLLNGGTYPSLVDHSGRTAISIADEAGFSAAMDLFGDHIRNAIIKQQQKGENIY